ncbi:MAG: hypothetical protein ACK5KQ_04980 [Anaerorhabdus sp.]
MIFKKKFSPEYNELKEVVNHEDDLKYTVVANDFFISVQNSEKINSEKKLKIYDILSLMGNSNKSQRRKFINKIEKLLK